MLAFLCFFNFYYEWFRLYLLNTYTTLFIKVVTSGGGRSSGSPEVQQILSMFVDKIKNMPKTSINLRVG